MKPVRGRTPWSARYRNLPIKLFFILILAGLAFLHVIMLFNAMALLDLL